MNALEVANQLLNSFGVLVQTAIPIAFALAILGFFFGLARYIFSAGDEEKRKEGKSMMVWGLVAVFVLVSLFGIIRLFQRTLGVGEGNVITQPFDAPRINVR